MQEIWAIILAAGSGQRMQDTASKAKQYIDYQGQALYLHSALTFAKLAQIKGLVFVFPEADIQSQTLYLANKISVPYKIVAGGSLRQDSAYNGLQALPKSCELVFIHDAARPFFTANLLQKLLAEKENYSGIIPALTITDTIKSVENSVICQTVDRSKLFTVQTPQLFTYKDILQAHANKKAELYTDDASLLEAQNLTVKICDGEKDNIKITFAKDLSMLEQINYEYRSLYAEDIHKYTDPDFIKARPMKLGGIEIPKAPHIEAHSDGDVLLHALADAILAASSSPDIGQLFSDQDPAFDNLSSTIILDKALSLLQQSEGKLSFVDLTIVAQIPKIAPYSEQIKKNIARLLNLEKNQVSLKAKTSEGLGFIGECKAIKAIALVNCKFPIQRKKI